MEIFVEVGPDNDAQVDIKRNFEETSSSNKNLHVKQKKITANLFNGTKSPNQVSFQLPGFKTLFYSFYFCLDELSIFKVVLYNFFPLGH